MFLTEDEVFGGLKTLFKKQCKSGKIFHFGGWYVVNYNPAGPPREGVAGASAPGVLRGPGGLPQKEFKLV